MKRRINETKKCTAEIGCAERNGTKKRERRICLGLRIVGERKVRWISAVKDKEEWNGEGLEGGGRDGEKGDGEG